MGKVDDAFQEATIKVVFWRQRMKKHWIATGDLPTTLLYSRVKVRQNRNEVLALKNQHGDWEEGQNKMQEFIVNSLKPAFNPAIHNNNSFETDTDLVSREMHLPQLSERDLAHLARPFLDNDIRSALFSIDNTKSPGPPGYLSAFFKEHWDTVGSSVCEAVRSFLTTGFLLKE